MRKSNSLMAAVFGLVLCIVSSHEAAASAGMPRSMEFRGPSGEFLYADLGELDLASFVFQKCASYAGLTHGVFQYSAQPVTFSFNQQLYRMVRQPLFYPGFSGHLVSDQGGAVCQTGNLNELSGLTLRLVFEAMSNSDHQIILTLDLASGSVEVSRNELGETQHYLSFGRISRSY